ncbi:host attachment family protein [Leptolyngbya sp. 15MV]|nr:host attachment family protein [Leptolyngbya sp. 15MV]
MIIAPPKALGEIRRHYGKSLEKQIVGEIAKGLTGRPAAEIVQALRGA